MTETLISRLQALTEPSREIDAEIALANGWTHNERSTSHQEPYWFSPNSSQVWVGPPRFTESIDAVLTLMPEGWAWSIHDSGRFGIGAGVSEAPPTDEWSHSDCGGVDATALLPTIALLIAIMKAQEESKR